MNNPNRFQGSWLSKLAVVFLTPVLFHSLNVFGEPVPPCLDHGQDLSENNDEVLVWKTTTKNQFQSRAHILGHLTQVYADHSGHHHMQVQIGSAATETLEVIYNEDFGPVPTLNIGAEVEACGDYITALKQSGPYPPSPDGAIIHWIHKSPNPHHESGYLVIDGVVCGQSLGKGGSAP